MQNSLNQAFIRAYAKERDAVHAQAVNSAADSQAATQRANEELILRIDTTSVEIPRPHITSRPSVRQTAAVIVAAEAATAQHHARAVSNEEEKLRASIASEMLRAGRWQNEQIASLGPISTEAPAASVVPEKVRSALTKPPEANIAEDAEPRSNTFEKSDSELLDTGTTRFFSHESVRPTIPDNAGKPGSIVRLDKALGSTTTTEQPKPVPKVAPKVSESTPQDVEKPKATQKTEEQSIAAAVPVVDSEAERLSRSKASAQAKKVERELRSAKVRVFNPIWEVDQLQWPEVCVQLMNARMDSLNHVTKHLSDACQEGLQVLAVTSPEGGEGRTTVACCLAMLAGNRGLKVAIVDGDIENPTLSLQTNLEVENDWQTAIMNQLPLEEVAVHSIDDQITLVPLLSPLDQNELQANDQRIADMFIELAESFDLVILDVGHMSSPHGLMSSLADQGIINAAIAVIDNRNTSTQRTETCIRRIRQTGLTSIGLVENFASSSQ